MSSVQEVRERRARIYLEDALWDAIKAQGKKKATKSESKLTAHDVLIVLLDMSHRIVSVSRDIKKIYDKC